MNFFQHLKDLDNEKQRLPVAVIGRRPDCDKRLVLEHVLESLLHKLVCAADELQTVDVIELCSHLAAK